MKKTTFIILCIFLGLAGEARPDATVIVTNTVKGTLYYQLGANLTPYINWQSGGSFDSAITNLGIPFERLSLFYGEDGRWVHDYSFYPYKNGWQWNAASMMWDNSVAGDVDFLKRNNLSALLLFDRGLNNTVSYPDATVNFDEAANYIAGVVNYYVNIRGVAVPFFELGNECNLGGFPRANTGKYRRDANPENAGSLPNADWSSTLQTNLEYFAMFQQLYPKIKAVSPATKVSLWPGSPVVGNGAGGDGFFWTVQKAPGYPRPDVRSFHAYGDTGQGNGTQVALDREYIYTGYSCPSGDCSAGGWMSLQGSILNNDYGITNGDVMISEWNYASGNFWVPERDTMWGVDYFLEGLARIVNSFSNYKSVAAANFFDTYSDGATDHLLDGAPPSLVTTLGMGMRLMKPLKGLDKRILRTKVTSADNINFAEGPSQLVLARVNCISVRGNTTYGLMINNGDVSVAQNVTVTVRGLTNNPVVVQVYSNKLSVSNMVPSKVLNTSLVAGTFSVGLPPLGIAVVNIAYGGLRVTNISTAPSTVTNNNNHLVIFSLKALSTGLGIVTNVSIDLSSIGGSVVRMTNISGATLFRYAYTVPSGLLPGAKQMPITARDTLNNLNLGNIAYLTDVLAAPRIIVTNLSVTPSVVSNNVPHIVVFQLKAKDLAGGTITNVMVDLSPLSGDPHTRMTNISGHTLFRYAFTIPAGNYYSYKTNDVMVYSSYYGTLDISHSFNMTIMFYNQIPGTIHAVDYNFGGEGVGYYDTTPGNAGGYYRNDDVDIANTDPPLYGGYYVGWIQPGEWLQYSVNVLTTGLYYLSTRIAKWNNDSSFVIMMDGIEVTNVYCNTTNHMDTINDIASNIVLTSGWHQMRLNFTDCGGLSWLRFDLQGLITGSISASSMITNVTLHGVSTGGRLIPGSTASIRVSCTNGKSVPATGPIVCQPVPANTVYMSDSSTNGMPLGWSGEWSTNVNPSQIFLSPNYTTVSPAANNIRWVRWKRTSGPMPANSSAVFRYRVIIK